MGWSAADWLRVGRAERAARCDPGHLLAAAPFNQGTHPASLTLERLRKLRRRRLPVARHPPAPRAGLSGHPEPSGPAESRTLLEPRSKSLAPNP